MELRDGETVLKKPKNGRKDSARGGASPVEKKKGKGRCGKEGFPKGQLVWGLNATPSV